MPSSSTALNLGLWGVPFRGGIPLGDLTLAYQSDVEAVSAISPEALTAVNNLLYAEYPNGSGGTGKVVDFIDDIDYLWPCIGNDLTAALVCVKGSNTNNGFVNGDYSESVGLTGDGTSFLATNIVPSSDLDRNNLHISIVLGTNGNDANGGIGADQGGSQRLFLITSNSSGLFLADAFESTTNARFIGNHLNRVGFWSLNIVSSAYSEVVNNTSVLISKTNTLPGIFPTASINIFKAATSFSQQVVGATIGKGLTAQQRTILSNAFNAFDTARSSL